ncbi:hypothetical protein [Nocardioides pyridinolyticus]
MPDPIDELENFSLPGPAMNPLPAAEVRRRGNRIRRRNNALATVGGLAVVAIIAAPFALAAGGSDSDSVQPAPQPPGGWTQTIPPDFDLGALPDTATFAFDVRDESVVDDVRVCGEEVYSTSGTTDVAGAHWAEPGSEGGTGRTLAVYADEAAARAALDDLRRGVLDCPRDGRLVNTESRDLPVPGAEDAFLWRNEVADGDFLHDTTGFQAVRVGNALYLATTFSSASEEQANTVGSLLRNSAPVVDQLCVFSVDGCAAEEPSEAVDEPTGLTGAIPDDFPLERGLPTSQANGAVGLEGPSHDLDLAPYNVENAVQACGVAPTGRPEPVDTLYAGYRSPAEGILRQLMTFASVAHAQAYVDGTVAPFAACPEDTDDRGVSKLYEVTRPDLGDASAVSVVRVEVDGEPGVSYQVVALTRVGQAVLFTLVNNDTQPFDPSRPAMYLENTQSVVDEMS